VRDNPAEGGVRQPGRRPLPRVGGDDGIAARSREKRLIVPTEVLQHGQNGLYVLTTAVISDGLKEGDRVVTPDQFVLQPGSIVSIDAGSGT
jgi:hypothetical protein